MSAVLCKCGCGAAAPLATKNDRSKGHIKGQPIAYVKGHNFRIGQRGVDSPNWNGGRSISPNGYVVLHTDGGRKYEHIAIAEQVLGMPLPQYGKGDPRNVVVHHIDGNKQNNVKTNLLICTHAYHTALHHRLEQSPVWPEFRKVTRFTGRAAA
jgi:hypothetical protein